MILASVMSELKRFKEAPWVKAIVVRIDSPGGAVAPTQEIFDELQKTKKRSRSSLLWGAWRPREVIISPARAKRLSPIRVP